MFVLLCQSIQAEEAARDENVWATDGTPQLVRVGVWGGGGGCQGHIRVTMFHSHRAICSKGEAKRLC